MCIRSSQCGQHEPFSFYAISYRFLLQLNVISVSVGVSENILVEKGTDR